MSAKTHWKSRVAVGLVLVQSVLAGGCASMQSAPAAGPERPPLAAYGVTQRYVAGELEFETCRLVDCPQPTVKTRPQPIRPVSNGVLGQPVPMHYKPLGQTALESALPPGRQQNGERTP